MIKEHEKASDRVVYSMDPKFDPVSSRATDGRSSSRRRDAYCSIRQTFTFGPESVELPMGSRGTGQVPFMSNVLLFLLSWAASAVLLTMATIATERLTRIA